MLSNMFLGDYPGQTASSPLVARQTVPERVLRRICQTEASCVVKDPSDADIAGIGVVLSFLLTSIITLSSIIAAYFTGFIHQDSYRPADREFIRGCRALVFFWRKQDEKEEVPMRRRRAEIDAFEGFILSFSDQQLVTGLAILVTLYAKSCQVSVFSFQVATGLAFFSLVLHLSTLAVLRERIAQNVWVRGVRFAAMIIFGVMMLASLVLSQSASFTSPEQQIRCALADFRFVVSDKLAWIQYGNTALLLWFVISSYGTAMGGLFDKSFYNFMGSWYFWLAFKVKNKNSEQYVNDRIKKSEELSRDGVSSKPDLKTVAFIAQEIARSFLWKMVWMLFYFNFALTNFFMVWLQGDYLQESLSTWGFGQIMPMLLLVIPVFTFIDLINRDKDPAAMANDDQSAANQNAGAAGKAQNTGADDSQSTAGGSQNAGANDSQSATGENQSAGGEKGQNTGGGKVINNQSGNAETTTINWKVVLRWGTCAVVIPYTVGLQFYAFLVAGIFSVTNMHLGERTDVYFVVETVFLVLGYVAAGSHFFLSVAWGVRLRNRSRGEDTEKNKAEEPKMPVS
ncbi:hypothetical protein B0T25DRAFT_530470 [Lasiosphaeria hispida]|uniref:Transmembrane protein n=1 Tax=Lasiosphaeria hispida TaxID=260671 RepID=A0AAJ0ML70_9PEZI|nr:hypothetical protein B0T25DRAFT_530470 [Lasiosphaeria hispida]